MIVIQWKEIQPTNEIIHFGPGIDPIVKTNFVKRQVTWSQDDSDESLQAAIRYVESEEFYNDKRDWLKVRRIK